MAGDRKSERVEETRPLRVLHIIQNLNYGGMERLIADMTRGADPDRVSMHVLALEYLGRFAAGLESFATLHVAEPMPRYSMLWPSTLVRQIAAIAPDVVHTHSGVWYKATLAAKRAGVSRVVHTEHGRQLPDPWRARFLDGLAARRTDVVVAVSAAAREQLSTGVVGDPRRIRVVVNGVDTRTFCPTRDSGRIRAELGLGPEVPVIGSIGRLEPIKGYDRMVDSFAALRRRCEGRDAPVLVIAGDGSERAALQRRIDAGGMRDSVFLLGWRDDVRDLHSAFTIFTMSSRSEGTSVSLLEAMSARLCPVVTDVGGNAEVLGPGLAHRLVVSGDADGLAAAWEEALSDAPRRSTDAEVARARVQHAFSLERMLAAYDSIYRGAEA